MRSESIRVATQVSFILVGPVIGNLIPHGCLCSCGSNSHQTKDCLERPRTKGAKWTNKNIAADDKVEDIQLATWDAKRDRWNGFDAKDYNKVVERYDQVIDHHTFRTALWDG